ncbi:MAG: hypothetical protein MRECE_48c008 [Mycoplasmataceae bacterium CE_OT135]|nr:MAG: hypothetical protein MRECE_48c002 [Mycoplasmataceae bacterium CE_OT135]KLL02745.1 MAG: hypothetical protein MRECE_48c008 [Mycoplasmataceae bacterium CE_OT135]
MYQIRLPISLWKIVYGLAVVTEKGSWATKHTAWVAEKTALVAEKVSEVAENMAYYAKVGAENIKAGAEKFRNLNEKIEQKARETKIEYQQAIRKEEFRQINQEIIDGSEKYNPQLVERTDAELADWVLLEK